MADVRRLFDTAFKQQRLPAWQPLLTPKTVMLIFATTGILFMVIGVLIVIADRSVVEYELPYPSSCNIGSTCIIEHIVDQDMATPVFFYYKIAGMYQNHRRYVKSKSDNQLHGVAASNFKTCEPLIRLPSDRSKVIYPCGLIAASVFSDTIQVRQDGVLLQGDAWNKTNIIWPSDRSKFKENDFYKTQDFIQESVLDGKKVALPPVVDEDFIVWMRTAGLPTFKKLYRIKQDKNAIPKGAKLEFTIENNYDVSHFGGTKSIMISTTSFLGGKNPFLGWAYVVVAAVSLVFAAALAFKYFLYPRTSGDLTYWEKNHAH